MVDDLRGDNGLAPALVSVVIPTKDRAESLQRTLSCLEEQTYSADSLEVLLVDDSSRSDTERMVAERAFPFELRYVRGKAEGAVGARNLGVSLARGTYVVLLDDDIRVQPEFLTEIVAEMERHPAAVVVGTLAPYMPPGEDAQTPFRRLYAGLSTAGVQAEEGTDDGLGSCLAGLLGIRRDAYWEVGGMPSIGGDNRGAWTDVLFGYQAMRNGMEIRLCRRAVAQHDDHALAGLDTTCRLARRSAHEAAALFRAHPELSAQLPMFRDKLPIRWREDSPRLIMRKLARRAASTEAALQALGATARFVEKHLPSLALLRPLYRWVIGGTIYRGYREGVRAMEARELPTGEKAC